MEIDEACTFMADWEFAFTNHRVTAEDLYKLPPGDRLLADGRVLRYADFVKARSVLRKWENQQEPGQSGRKPMEKNLQARAYALALIQHAREDRDWAADTAAKKYGAKIGSVRPYLNNKTKDSSP